MAVDQQTYGLMQASHIHPGRPGIQPARPTFGSPARDDAGQEGGGNRRGATSELRVHPW